MEGNVAAILGNGRPHAGLEQLLDGANECLVAVFKKFAALGDGDRFLPGQHWRGRQVMVHDVAQNGRLQMLPLALALGDGNEILAQKHARNTWNREQLLRQHTFIRLVSRPVFAC